MSALGGRQFSALPWAPETLATPLPGNGLKHGISTLHAWIPCLECVLHVSYKLGIRKHQARSAEDKVSIKLKKKTIQEQIKE